MKKILPGVKKIQPAQPTGPVGDSTLSQSRLKSAEMGLT